MSNIETRGMKNKSIPTRNEGRGWETEGRWTEVWLVLTPSECGRISTATGWKHAPLKRNGKKLSLPSLLLSFITSVSPSDPPSSSHSLVSFLLSICYSLQHHFGHMLNVWCKSDKNLDHNETLICCISGVLSFCLTTLTKWTMTFIGGFLVFTYTQTKILATTEFTYYKPKTVCKTKIHVSKIVSWNSMPNSIVHTFNESQ